MSGAQLVYDRVPSEVTRVSAYVWRSGIAPVPLAISLIREGGQFVITLPASQSAIVLLQRKDDAYLIDGPVVIGDAVVQRVIDPTWRHTIESVAEDRTTGSPPLDWLSAGGVAAGGWPACWWRDAVRWACLGAPLDAPGVILALAGSGVLSGVASGDSIPELRVSAWGRLVIVGDRDGGPLPRVRLSAARPVLPSQRSRAVRLETAPVPDLHVSALAAGVYWVAGDSSPPEAWLEIRSARSGPAYLPLADVAQGSPQLPVQVTLDDRRDIRFSIASSGGDVAGGALVTVFRVLDLELTAARDQPPPRRVLAGEATADGAGIAQIDGLGDAEYEVLAWHPQFGRASVRLARGDDQVAIRLQSPGVARGRVLVGGKPAAGVDVVSVPDPTAYLGAADPIDLKGGDTRSGVDGRFWVALASAGGGELRVGGGAFPIVRLALPRAALPIVDLGDVELGRPLAIQVTLDQDPGCDLRATGPVGRSGLQIVAAIRTGPGLFALTLPEEGSWEFVLLCGRNERRLVPSMVNVSARDGPRDVRLTVR